MGENELISIILPVHNGEKYLRQAIESCLNQVYSNFELIIVDDASIDQSFTIIEEYKKSDSRIKVIRNKTNLALPESLNVGHRASRGRFITWTSDDNKMKENCLKRLYETITKDDCDLVYSNYDVIWTDGRFKRVNHNSSVTSLIFDNSIGASFLYKKEIYEELNGYRNDLFLVEDYQFFLKASFKFKFRHLKESLYSYRIHPRSLTSKINADENFNARFKSALRKLYEEVGEDLQFSEITVEFLLSFYFQKNTLLKIYLENKQIIEMDLLKYEDILVLPDEDILYLLRSRIRENWTSNQKNLTLRNLFQVLIKNRSLIIYGGKYKKQTLGIVYNCFKNF
jgi:glycosyltransferase involved in cell wall biosynthesis